jgi:hypothetical protein
VVVGVGLLPVVVALAVVRAAAADGRMRRRVAGLTRWTTIFRSNSD